MKLEINVLRDDGTIVNTFLINALKGLEYRYSDVPVIDEESGIILRGFKFQPIVELSKKTAAKAERIDNALR